MTKKMKNPLHRRLPRELKSEFGKYLVIFLFFIMVIYNLYGYKSRGVIQTDYSDKIKA